MDIDGGPPFGCPRHFRRRGDVRKQIPLYRHSFATRQTVFRYYSYDARQGVRRMPDYRVYVIGRDGRILDSGQLRRR